MNLEMNLEEIKKRLAYFPRELKDGGFSDNSLAFGAKLDIEYLLSIIEQSQGDENNNAFWKLYDRFEDKIAKCLNQTDQILALQSKLEQAEKALEKVVELDGYVFAVEALQAIRGSE